MYIELEEINLVLTIILKLILIIGSIIICFGLITLINRFNRTLKNVETGRRFISNLFTIKNLPEDMAKLGRTSFEYELSKIITKFLRRLKSRNEY